MSYLGNAPARSFISFERQVFTIVNSQTAYALSHSVTNENDIRLVVNNVVQEPGSGKAYTATGTALTLSAALTNGTDEMYCVFLGRATATSAPGAGSIGTAQLADLNVTSGKIANDAVTLAKMASGTDGNIISYDASGNPVAVATGNDGQVLTSTGAGSPPAFETPASATNTPAFEAYLSGDQNIGDGNLTKITFQTEVYDDGGGYDNSSNYRFTVPSGQGGTYKFYTTLNFDDNQNAEKIGFRQLYFYKNGSSYAFFYNDNGTSKAISSNWGSANITMVLNATDYVEVYAMIGQTADNAATITGYSNGKRYSVFGGYKIIR